MNAKKKVLVTGASGMLGKALIQKLLHAYQVHGVSKSGSDGSNALDLSQAVSVQQAFETFKPDWVVHTAAYSDVDGCERDPKLAHEANAISVKNVAEACSFYGSPLIHVSTDYVFDGRKRTPYHENDPTGPINIYGITKLTGEYHALKCRSFSACVRTSWLFGPGNPKNFVNAITTKLIQDKKVSVLDDQVDSPTSVADLSEALICIGEKFLSQKESGRPPRHEIYQVCNDGGSTRYDMAVEIKKILNLSDAEVSRADRASVQGRVALRPAYAVMSRERYETEFCVQMRPWQVALSEYLKEPSCVS